MNCHLKSNWGPTMPKAQCLARLNVSYKRLSCAYQSLKPVRSRVFHSAPTLRSLSSITRVQILRKGARKGQAGCLGWCFLGGKDMMDIESMQVHVKQCRVRRPSRARRRLLSALEAFGHARMLTSSNIQIRQKHHHSPASFSSCSTHSVAQVMSFFRAVERGGIGCGRCGRCP